MLERYWVWERDLWGHNPKRPDSTKKEKTIEMVKAADAQATIADLQGQVEAAQEWLSLCQHELGSVRIDRAILQQRVAQLKQERDAFESHAIDLQADHARVLGLLAQVTEIADMMLKGTECEHDVGLCSCEHRRIVKQAQRSLPAQPAQGGA